MTTSTLPAPDRSVQTDLPFETTLAEYQAACADRDRLKVVSGGNWTPELGKARREELRTWVALKRLAWERLE